MPKEKEDDSNSKRWGGGLAVLIMAGIAVPVLYVASLGPAAWLMTHGFTSPSVDAGICLFYAPLILLSEQNETFARFLHWYEHFCSQGR